MTNSEGPVVILVGHDAGDLGDLVRAAPSDATVLHLPSMHEARRLLAEAPAVGRGDGVPEMIIREWCLELHLVAREAVSHDARAKLRGMEFWLLWELMDHGGQEVSPQHLLSHVWEAPPGRDSTVVRQGIKTLRRTLGGLRTGVGIETGRDGYRLAYSPDATCCEGTA